MRAASASTPRSLPRCLHVRRSMATDWLRHAGHVHEYTPPVLYNRENRNRLVFMIEARPTAEPEALRPGQPVDVALAAAS